MGHSEGGAAVEGMHIGESHCVLNYLRESVPRISLIVALSTGSGYVTGESSLVLKIELLNAGHVK